MFSLCREPTSLESGGLTNNRTRGKAQMERGSNRELPQSTMCAYAQGIGSEDLASGGHTKHCTRETTFQPLLDVLCSQAAHRLSGLTLPKSWYVSFAKDRKQQDESLWPWLCKDVLTIVRVNSICMIHSRRTRALCSSLATSDQKQGVTVQVLGQTTWRKKHRGPPKVHPLTEDKGKINALLPPALRVLLCSMP